MNITNKHYSEIDETEMHIDKQYYDLFQNELNGLFNKDEPKKTSKKSQKKTSKTLKKSSAKTPNKIKIINNISKIKNKPQKNILNKIKLTENDTFIIKSIIKYFEKINNI